MPVEPDELSRMHRQVQGEIRSGDDDTPLPLPLEAEPTRTELSALTFPKLDPPRTPARQGILPGLAALPAIDDSATVPVPLLDEDAPLENTPPPLPPSPASAAAEVWLEDAVTRPSSMMPDLAETSGGMLLGPTGSVSALAAPVLPMVFPGLQVERGGRALLLLSSATFFVVGLVLGALLFRGGRSGGERSAAERQPMTVCAPSETPDAASR